LPSFGDTVRDQRLRMGLSQAEVAKEAGISSAELDEIENGRQEPAKAIIKNIRRSLILQDDKLASTGNKEGRE